MKVRKDQIFTSPSDLNNFVSCKYHAFNDLNASICIISFSGDWLFPTSESRKIVHALNAKGVDVSFIDIASNKGHDAFLMDEPDMFITIDGFLKAQFDK